METVREASVVGVEWSGTGEQRNRRPEGRGGRGPSRDSGRWWTCRGETPSGSSWGAGEPQVQEGQKWGPFRGRSRDLTAVAATGVPNSPVLDTF